MEIRFYSNCNCERKYNLSINKMQILGEFYAK